MGFNPSSPLDKSKKPKAKPTIVIVGCFFEGCLLRRSVDGWKNIKLISPVTTSYNLFQQLQATDEREPK